MRFLVIFGCCILLLFSVTTLGVLAKAPHSCAPSVPPPVTGPLAQPAAVKGLLFINEVLLTPHAIWNCSSVGPYTAKNNSWVEIYNAQAQAFDLYAVHAALDNGPQTGIFYFPFGSAIAAHSFLVVFPQINSPLFQNQTSRLRLLINDISVDDITIPALGRDQSYARMPDGSATWQITTLPTIDASNTNTSSSANGGTNSTSTATGSSHGTVTHSNHPTQNTGTGVQPTWTTLHLPATPTMTSVFSSTISLPAINSDPQQADTWHKLILSALVIALGLTLWWCWKLSSK